jgi:hemolysin activation/secretion protein/AraC-like DNA-binding protein
MHEERHLALQEITLLPCGEWPVQTNGWLMIRAVEGTGYWLCQGAAREFSVSEVLLVSGTRGGSLRASSLGTLRLQFFCVQPRLLPGLLALGDSQHLEAFEGAAVHVFGAQHAVTRRFAEVAGQPACTGLAFRCRLLEVWCDAVSGLSPQKEAEAQEDVGARLRQLITQMPEADLLDCSLSSLATQLHCSERHFSRLFRRLFGVPFRARQTESRLLRARQMLIESDQKIIHVAYESGFRHLSLFNTMFKKRFGMTPSQARNQFRKPQRPHGPRLHARASLLLAFFCLLLFSSRTVAQTNATVGQSNASVAQTNAPAATEPTFAVTNFTVRGNTLLKKDVVEEILAEGKGTNVTLTQIRKALANLQTAYRERGWATVAVTLPQQKLTNQTVIVQVTQGPLKEVNVVGNRFFSSNNVMRALPSLQGFYYWHDFYLNSHVFQRELDLANANRDRQIYPVLGPGPDPGTSELTLKVKDRLPLHGRLELNDYYTPGTPELRMNLNSQYNNLWQADHSIGFQYSFSPQELKVSDMKTLGLLDQPMIANYSAYYRIPFGNPSSLQEQIEADPLSFGYNEATHKFNVPPASSRPEFTVYASRSTSDTGVKFGERSLVTQASFITIDRADSGEDVTVNEGIGSRLTVPIREIAGIRSILSFGFDFKRYQLWSYNTNNFYITTTITNQLGSQTLERTVASGQPTRHERLDYLPLTAGIDLARPDKFGTTFFNAALNINAFHPKSSDTGDNTFSSDADFAAASYSTNAHAGYITVGMGLTREQRICGDWSVLLRANGQWASCPLNSNEQFAMGGLSGVRGYLDGEAYGDSGWRTQVEPRTPAVNLGMVDYDVPFMVRGSVFADYGQLYLADTSVGKSFQEFLGVGFAVSATVGNNFEGRLTVATPVFDGPHQEHSNFHFYFSLAAQF